MRISQLPAKTTAAGTDVFAVDGSITQKITAANLAGSLITIAAYSYTFTGSEVTAANPQHIFDVAKTGYKPIMAVVTSVGDNQAYYYSCVMSQTNNTVTVAVHSIRSTPNNGTLQILVLYSRT